MPIDIRLLGPEDHAAFIAPLRVSFGLPDNPERTARAKKLHEITQRLAAFDGDTVVGCAGAYTFDMTIPGGTIPIAGLTMVGVLPTHRRRGILRQLMREHFSRAREEKRAISALWSAEPGIYGRFGYGTATFCAAVSIERSRAALRKPFAAHGQMRLLDEASALSTIPSIWDRVRAGTPGMLTRTPAWWEVRRLGDYEKSSPPLQRVVLFLDGRPEGYALYRFANQFAPNTAAEGTLRVLEALGTSAQATALVWRYLLEFDLARRIEAQLLPPEHPLMHLVSDPRSLGMTLADGLWLRLIDVEAALGARAWSGRESVVIEVEDALCPWNRGRYCVDGNAARASRTEAPAELRLDVSTLGASYLGAVPLRRLADAGELEELSPGAVDRADGLFRWPRPAWCPEIF